MLFPILARVGTLMLSFGLLVLATGTFNTFMSIRGDLEGFSTPLIGAMMSAFYVGLVLGGAYADRFIGRVGHIRAFTAFASLSAVVVLAHAFFISAPLWIALRAVFGFASAGLYICTESWLNDRVTPDTRGTVLSLHATVVFFGLSGGQLMLNVGDPAGADLFMIAAMLFALGAIPIALTRTSNPEPRAGGGFNLRRLYDMAPSGIAACVAAGMSQASIFGVGPVFGRDIGLGVGQISLLMTALVIGGLFLQFPIGRLSDRYDRRGVMFAVSLGALVLAAGLIGFVRTGIGDSVTWTYDGPILLLLAFAFGGLSATLYPLGIAYANDYLLPEQRVQAAGALVLAYGLGAVSGPVLAAATMRWTGPAGLFVYNLAVAAGLGAFIYYRSRRRGWAGIAEKERFRALPEAASTPGGVDYDPRWDEPREFDTGSDPAGDELVSPAPAPGAEDADDTAGADTIRYDRF